MKKNQFGLLHFVRNDVSFFSVRMRKAVIARHKAIQTLKYTVLITILILLTISCKTKQKVPSGNVIKNMNKETLIDNVINNQIDFKSIYFKKMNIDLDDNGKSYSVKANMYIDKDKQIIIQVMMLIEVARILIEPNEITVLNRINREVYTTNFGYINKKFNIDLNFTLLQSILTNMLFYFPTNDPKMIKQYQISEQKNNYILKNEQNNNKNPNQFFQQIEITSNEYKIIKHLIYNISGISVDINYNNFDKLENKKFPYFVSLKGKNGKANYGLTLKYSNIEVNGKDKLTFSIPSNYSKGTLNF
jgi:hypothetical protein